MTGAGSKLNFQSLSHISSTGKGRIEFSVSDASISLPALQAVSNTTFSASNGATITVSGPASATYSSTGLYMNPSGSHNPWNWDLLKADGDGTTLDLSSLSTLDCGFNDGSSTGTFVKTNYQHVKVTDGATMDLSGVQTIIAPVRSDDYVKFAATGAGSVLDMSSLATITNAGSGKVYVNIADGGHVKMGDVNNTSVTTAIDLNTNSLLSVASLQSDSPLSIKLNTASDRVNVAGSLLMGNTISLTAPAGGTVRVGGDFLHTHENTAGLNLGLSHVELVGSSQQLEVGGTDFDLQWQLFPDDNFGFEQLVIGEAGHAGRVTLVDLHDNLQPGVADALYLFGVEDVAGVGGLEGLRILGGSTLDIGETLNVYALLDLDGDGVMERTRIRDLFAPGQSIISFDHNGNDGFIVTPEPATMSLLALGGLALLRRRQRRNG